MKAHGGLRGVLAVQVALYHHGFRVYGESGLSLFFMLSGFALAAAYGGGRRGEALQCGKYVFYKNRVARSFPVYWVTTIAAIPLWWMCPGKVRYPGHLQAATQLVANLFAVCTWLPFKAYLGELNDPAWTISTLWAMWLAFPYALRFCADKPVEWLSRAPAIAHWLAALFYLGPLFLASEFSSSLDVGRLAYMHPASRFPLFFAGMCAGLWRSSLTVGDVVKWPHPLTWFTPGLPCCFRQLELEVGDEAAWATVADGATACWIGAVLLAGWLDTGGVGRPDDEGNPLNSQSFLNAVLSFVQITCFFALTLDGERSYTARFFLTKPLVYLGKLSLSLYLSHSIVFRYCGCLFGNDKGNLTSVWILFLLPLAILVSAVLFHGFEEPLRKFLRKSPPARVGQAPAAQKEEEDHGGKTTTKDTASWFTSRSASTSTTSSAAVWPT